MSVLLNIVYSLTWDCSVVDDCATEDCLYVPYFVWVAMNVFTVLIGSILVTYVEVSVFVVQSILRMFLFTEEVITGTADNYHISIYTMNHTPFLLKNTLWIWGMSTTWRQ